MDENIIRDRNTFLQQYRDMIRYIMAHRKVIKYINAMTMCATIIGIFSSTILGLEVIMDGVPEHNQKAVYGTLAFASAITTAAKEIPWIQKRLKNQHKLLTELRSWQTQYYSAARKYYETGNITWIQEIKKEYEEIEDDLLNREGAEDVNLGGRISNIFLKTRPEHFENQYQIKYRRVSSFVVKDNECLRTSSDSPESEKICKGFSEELVVRKPIFSIFKTIKEDEEVSV